MIVESIKKQPFSNTVKTFDFDIINQNLLAFIEANLSEFASKNSKKRYNEEYLTQRLVLLLLQNCIDKPFVFVQENVEQGKRSKVDIGVYTREKEYDNVAFFVIEAKRLPAPPPKNRKYEYVFGDKKNGAIERFKRNSHGEFSNGRSIIGYVEQHEFDYWLSEINTWISLAVTKNSDSSIVWDNSEKLKELDKNSVFAKYNSENMRNNATAIKIVHYFIKMH